MPGQGKDSDCCCGGASRREFLAAGVTAGLIAVRSLSADAAEKEASAGRRKEPAAVRAVFLYPPSKTFADDPDGWWSWPGNEFDAEGRQKRYTAELQKIEKKFGMKIDIEDQPIATDKQVERLKREVESQRLDGLLLVMFYNRSLGHADALLKAAEEAGIPVVFFVGLGVKHGRVDHYRREGVYFIQSLDNFEAIEYGLRMINARKRMSRARLLSITEAKEPREGVEKFFGTTVRVVPFREYADAFGKIKIDLAVRDWIKGIRKKAIEIRGVTDACMVRGHHNLLFCGDEARKFRLFAQLYKIRLAETGYIPSLPT